MRLFRGGSRGGQPRFLSSMQLAKPAMGGVPTHTGTDLRDSEIIIITFSKVIFLGHSEIIFRE